MRPFSKIKALPKKSSRRQTITTRRVFSFWVTVFLFATLFFVESTYAANAINSIALNGVTLNGFNSITVSSGSTITVAVTNTTSGGTSWGSTQWLIGTTPPGTWNCDAAPTPSITSNGTNTTTLVGTVPITAPIATGTYNVYFMTSSSGSSCSNNRSSLYTITNAVTVAPPPPVVTAINTASTNPTAANLTVQWTVVFNTSVTGVDASDFTLVQAGGVTGANITGVTGSGATWTVSANTGIGTVGTLKLNLVDNDSIVNASSTPLGGAGVGNGNFGGQTYTLIVPVCNSAMLFCDDFERTVISGGSNTAGAVGTAVGYGAWTVAPLGSTCAGSTGNTGCAGIDSDVPPWSTASSPRANSTRAAFTRWSNVTVTSPVINLASLPSRSKSAQISFWLRRGSDCFSEWPGDNPAGCNATLSPTTAVTGEEFRVEYKNSAGTWVTLAQYPTENTPGEIMTPVIDLPDDALHANFQLRFTQPGGSGSSGSGGATGVVGYDYWHFDNVIVNEHPATSYSGAFCDTFEGDLSRWTMTGVGNVQIGSTYFQNGAHDMDLRWNTVNATTKTTDMTGAIGDITFWVKRGIGTMTGGSYPNTTGSEFPETTAKGLRVDYFNSSNAWITLTTFTGGGTAGQVYSSTTTPATNKFTLPSDAKHSKFKLRFTQLSGSGRYDEDYWHVDDVCVGTIIQAADLSLTKTSSGTFTPGQYVTYHLTVANAGPSVEPGAISITDTLPTGLSYQSGSAGWACSAAGQVVTCTRSGTLAVGASDTLTLTATVDNGIAAGTITNTATVGGQSLDNNLVNNTATKTDTVVVPSYVFTDQACSTDGTAIGTGTQCNLINWSPQIAGQALSSIYITAVNAAGIPTQLSGSIATTVNMQFALSCHNPTNDAGVAANFSAIATLPLCTANGAIPSIWSTATPLSFPAATASVGAYNFNYADVGSIELFMRNSAITTQIGKSGAFVVKPFDLVLSDIMPSSSPTGRCTVNPDSTPACANTATNNAIFVKAGEVFKATVTATTTSGAAAPNFGKEQSPETIRFTSTLIEPVGGSNPAISGRFPAFSNGTVTGTAFSWNEVGIITLTPSISDADYLGIGDIIGTTSGHIGRFYPDHFAVIANNGAMTAACGGFTYTGQPMSYSTAPFLTIKAMNALATPTITTNYTGNFQKLTASNIVITAPVADSTQNGKDGTKTLLTAFNSSGLPLITLSTGTLTNNSGTMTYTLNNTDKYTYTRDSNALIAPYLSDISLVVTAVAEPTIDGVTATGGLPTLKPTGVNIRYGRLQFTNAYGSELLDLPLSLQVQYYANSGFEPSATDSCTIINATNFAFDFPAAASNHLSACETALTLTSSTPNFTATLSKVGTGNNGWTDITLNLNTTASGNQCTTVGSTGAAATTNMLPWLRYNWTGLGEANPTARATFGIYGGNNKIIYSREIY